MNPKTIRQIFTVITLVTLVGCKSAPDITNKLFVSPITTEAPKQTNDLPNPPFEAAKLVTNLPTLTLAPTIGTALASQTVPEGVGFNLSIIAKGTAPLIYQWYLNGKAISGALDSRYEVPSASVATAGTYTVSVRNGAELVTSLPLLVIVKVPDAKLQISLKAPRTYGDKHHTAVLVLTNASASPEANATTNPEILQQTIDFDKPTVIKLPIWFPKSALNGTSLHLALQYADDSYPFRWEKSIDISRGQEVIVTETVGVVIEPLAIELPGAYSEVFQNKLSPAIFYKDSAIKIRINNPEAKKLRDKARAFMVIYKANVSDSKKGDGGELGTFDANPEVQGSYDLKNVRFAVGGAAYDAVSRIKEMDPKLILSNESLAGHDFPADFVLNPPSEGLYNIVVWLEDDGQYAFSQQTIKVYVRR